MHADRVWLVTGSSRGFGKALIQLLMARGDRVVATAREPAALSEIVEPGDGRALAVELDVTDPDTVHNAVAQAVETFGRIDVLVNNAGCGLAGAVEEWSDEELRRQFDTNLFGAVSVTRSVLPVMRRQRSGTIVQMSSMAGVFAIPGWAAYTASKFALEGISEALAAEVAHLGIDVMIVEPGRFRTEFDHRSVRWAPPISDYAAVVGTAREEFASWDGDQPGDPVRGAQAVITALDDNNPPLRLPLGTEAFARIRDRLNARLTELDLVDELGMDAEFPSAHSATASDQHREVRTNRR